MTYASQYDLSADGEFQARSQAVIVEQGLVFKDDGRADIAALATHLLRGPTATTYVFTNLLAAAPGFATSVALEDGGIDQSEIEDAELLAAVQAGWPTVAALYFDAEGNPR